MAPVPCNSKISSPPEPPGVARISKRSYRLAQDNRTAASRRSTRSTSAAVQVPRTGEYVSGDRAAGVLLRLEPIPAPGTSTLRGVPSITSLAGTDLVSALDSDRTQPITASYCGRIEDISSRGDEDLLLRSDTFAPSDGHVLRGVPSITSLAGTDKFVEGLIYGNEDVHEKNVVEGENIASRGDEALLLCSDAFAPPDDHVLQGVPSITSLAGIGKFIEGLIHWNEDVHEKNMVEGENIASSVEKIVPHTLFGGVLTSRQRCGLGSVW